MNNLSELDILYSPSRWSKRLPASEILENHMEVITKKSEKTRKEVSAQLNISYGSGEREKYDIFGTDLDNSAPIFVFVHGGYWQEKDITHNIQSFMAENLHKNKIKSIFIGYELCPRVTVSDIMNTIEIAVNKCIEYAKKCKSRGLYLAGHSAGGQLVAALFTNYIKNLPSEDKLLIKDAFLLCGVYDLVPLTKTMYNICLKLDENTAKATSPYYQNIYNNEGTTFYVVAAENDSPVFKKQSREFHEKLVKQGVASKFLLIGNVDHFDVVEKLTENDYELSQIIVNAINC